MDAGFNAERTLNPALAWRYEAGPVGRGASSRPRVVASWPLVCALDICVAHNWRWFGNVGPRARCQIYGPNHDIDMQSDLNYAKRRCSF